MVAAAQSAGMKVRPVASAALEMPTDNARPPLWVRLGARKLESNWGRDVIGGARIAGNSADPPAARIGDGSDLLFDAADVAQPRHPLQSTEDRRGGKKGVRKCRAR